MKRTLLASLLVAVAGAGFAAVPAGTDEQISKRLEPFGDVCREGDACAAGASVAASGGSAKSGKEVYDTFCFACHATGMSDAPKLGDVQAWAPRIAKGMDELLVNTQRGLNIMPPKGTCMACSDAEIEATVNYMVDNSK